MATREEQETTVTWNRADGTVRIWTAYPPHVRKLRTDKRATETDGDATGDEWASFTLSASDFDPLKGFKRRSKPLTDEQRAELADRLARARQTATESDFL